MKHYDVAIVGAGPTGSTLARYLAADGIKVAMLEKKKAIGVPLQCAGLVAKNIKKINLLPEEFILNKVYGAYLHSPSDITFSVEKKEPEAYVLDRMAYDKFLANSAREKGAELLINHKVKAIDTEKGQIYVKNSEEERISAEVVVGADGYNSLVSSNFNPPPRTFQAAQYLLSVEAEAFDTNYVHVHTDSNITPGFIWIIPLSSNIVRVGLFSNFNYQDMNVILRNFISKHPDLKNSSIVKKYFGHIPVHDPKKKIIHNRAILLGDAASQVKPTSGGGLILGFICAQIASESIFNALENDNINLLQEYKAKYEKRFRKELKIQLKVQDIFKSMKNSDLDYMFRKLKEKGAEEIISEYGDMDTQSPLVKEMLKRGLLFSILPKLLSRRISSLWK